MNRVHCIDGYEISLLDDETLIECQQADLVLPDKPLNIIDFFTNLARVQKTDQIGEQGAIRASAIYKGNEANRTQGLFDKKFGRDGLISARATKEAFPKLLPATIIDFAEIQGVRDSIFDEQEVGRIFHEELPANDPNSQKLTKQLKWQGPYFYASIDATFHFGIAICEVVRAVGPQFLEKSFTNLLSQKVTVLDSLKAAIGWTKRRMATNPQGFVESKRKFPTSHGIQTMEDSWDSHFHADGTIGQFDRGITSIEAVGYQWQMLTEVSELYQDLGLRTEALDLKDVASRLKENIFRYLWINEDGGYFAHGGDRDESGSFRPFKIHKASQGELLATGILDEQAAMATAVVRLLMSDAMRCASGIRTCSTREVRFREGAYHNGNSWAFKTFLIAQGFERLGFKSEALALYAELIQAVRELHILPEYYRGGFGPKAEINRYLVVVFDKLYQRKNTIEQPPQLIQAWTVAAIIHLLHRCGLDPLFRRTIGVDRQFMFDVGFDQH